jgi:hypothetical protein
MIQRNVGMAERVVRFCLGTALLAFVFLSETLGIAQIAALPAAFALYWNSIFARCYLWKWLGIDTCKDADGKPCEGPGSGGSRA